MDKSTYRKHFVSLVKDKHLHGLCLEDAALNHVMNTAGGADNDLRAILDSLDIIPNSGATNAGVRINVHEIADCDHDLLDLLGQLTGGGEN